LVERLSTGPAAVREFEGGEGLIFLEVPRAVYDMKDLPSYNAPRTIQVRRRETPP